MNKFNLNDFIYVKLNGNGIKVYEEWFESYGQRPLPLKINERGFSRFQIHEFAHIFGKCLLNGNPYLPCETDFYIEQS